MECRNWLANMFPIEVETTFVTTQKMLHIEENTTLSTFLVYDTCSRVSNFCETSLREMFHFS